MASHRERRVPYLVKIHLWETWIGMRREHIAIIPADDLQRKRIGIEIHALVLNIIERANVIKSSHMVAMRMCDKDTFDMHNLLAKHLFTEIGSDIEEEILTIVVSKKRRSTKPTVSRIL